MVLGTREAEEYMKNWIDMMEQYTNNARGPSKSDILADFILEGQFIKSDWLSNEDLAYIHNLKRVFLSI